MARIGKVVSELKLEELQRRMLVTIEEPQAENPFEAAYVWAGSSSGMCRRLFRTAQRCVTRKGGHEFAGLRHAIETYYFSSPAIDMHAGADVAQVATPFAHFALCARNTPPNPAATEINLKQAFIDQFKRWSLEKPRIRYFEVSDLPRGFMCVHFGFGVFIPKADDAQVGSLQIAYPDQDDWESPVLPGLYPRQTAAFYPGQMGIAFASSPRNAFAFLERGPLPDDYIFYFGRLTDTDRPRFDYLHRDQARGEKAPRDGSVFMIGEREMAEGEPILVYERDVHGESRPCFQLRWTGDDGRDALKPKKPTGPHLELNSLILPECSRRSGVAEWWIDLTEEGVLATTPVVGRSLVLANASGGRMRLYDRRRMDDEVFKEKIPIGGAQVLYISELADETGRWRYRLTATTAKPLGYVDLPQRGTFFQVEPLRIQEAAIFALDWLDACSGIRLRGKAKENPSGLASWSLGIGNISLERTGDGRLAFRSQEPNRLARLDDNRITTVAPGDPVYLMPDDGIAVGCHFFIYRAGD